MKTCGAKSLSLIAGFFACCSAIAQAPSPEISMPAFGRNTILVYRIQNPDYLEDFVVRIAQFLPDRYVEWENRMSQGTVLMPNRDLESGKGYISSSLFQSGSDTKGKGSTTLWLSRNTFRDLKTNRKAKCNINGATGVFTYQGDGTIEVDVNRTVQMLPVIIVLDDRMEERWFLDQEDNPLIVNYRVRRYSQTLASITTDKPNTLRWIKGTKLENPPR